MPKLSDVEWIFVVLLVFYAIELVTWIKPGVRVFTSRLGSFTPWRDVLRLTGNENGALVLGGLTPSDAYLMTRPFDSVTPSDASDEVAFDIDAARDRIESWQTATKFVRPTAWLLLFWIAPVGVSLHYGWLPLPSDDFVTWIYLSVLFAIWWTTAGLIFRAHQKLYPNDRGARWKLAAYTIASPVVPLRGADYLARTLVEPFHPITIAAAIGTQADFQEFAASMLRKLYSPLPSTDPPPETLIDVVRGVIEKCELDPDELLAQPVPEDDQSQSYCARCRQQFELVDAACQQCEGLRATPFRSDTTNE